MELRRCDLLNSLRRLTLRQLDASIAPFQLLRTAPVSRKGWVREIRIALGMSAAQLGRRLGLTRQAVSALEHAEAGGSITLKSLKRAAEGLHCDLVYALVPRESLENLLDQRVRTVAAAMVKRASHSMALERQEVSDQEIAAQVEELADRLRSESLRHLWNEVDGDGSAAGRNNPARP